MTASHGKASERQTEGSKDEESGSERERHFADVKGRIKKGRVKKERREEKRRA